MIFAACWFMVGQDKNVAQIFLNYENSQFKLQDILCFNLIMCWVLQGTPSPGTILAVNRCFSSCQFYLLIVYFLDFSAYIFLLFSNKEYRYFSVLTINKPSLRSCEIGSSELSFIGYKQTNRQVKHIYRQKKIFSGI